MDIVSSRTEHPPQRNMQRRAVPQAAGFTLIELLVTVAVAGVLAAIAAPAFRSMLMNNRTNGTTDGFFSALNYARNTALSARLDVQVCPLGAVNPPSCGTSWGAGWVVYYPGSPASAALQSATIAANAATLNSPSSTLSVTFKPQGVVVTDNGANATFKLCDTRGANFARSLRILPSGLVQTDKPPIPQTGNTPARAVWDGSALACP